MILYRTQSCILIRHEGALYELESSDWDRLINQPELFATLKQMVDKSSPVDPADVPEDINDVVIAPIGSQEVWAAGVTYFKSRTARMEESSDAGGADFYDRVYHADRPELFFKASPHRVVGQNQKMNLRKDSNWMVPEPELTLLINSAGQIVGYTIGNDLSCRDIEGENPLYLPQAKTFDRCAALGPGVLITDQPLPPATEITIQIVRDGGVIFEGTTGIDQMKKEIASLAEYLYREASFPNGAYLMTGTGIVPGDDFTLQPGDRVDITIEGIGTLSNTMRKS
ncbi:MAG: fumarylacetoacetate hydrolase family protein [Planctomycetota bacterium]|jgi:2-dehydro-3-deoxy-D-arabinonate dehydratase